MKRLFLLFSILFVSTLVFSQEEQNRSSVFNIGDKYSWYVNPSISLTIFDINYGLIGSMELGISLNENISIGGFYSTGILGVDPDGYSYEEGYDNYLDLGGISMSYCFNPENLFHYTAFLKSGFGNLALLKDEEYLNFALYVFNPGISIEYKLTNHIKIGLQTSYRIISPVVLDLISETQLTGTEIGLSLKIGSF